MKNKKKRKNEKKTKCWGELFSGSGVDKKASERFAHNNATLR
jgi:hypothetical protein